MANLIDPVKLGATINKRTLGTTAQFSDAPLLSIVKIRPVKSDKDQALDISVDVAGCNFRCAHCWVSNASLSANFRDEAVRVKLAALPKQFQENPINADEFAAYLHARLKKSAKEQVGSGVSFSGGEPLPYRGGIAAIAKYFQNQPEPFYVNMETTGHLIAQDEGYLDAFEGLQDTLRFYVSIKAADDAGFAQFTGAEGAYHTDAFIALERLLKRGFLATPGGVTLNCFDPEKIPVLHAKLTEIHPDLPRALAYHSVTFGQVQAPEEQKTRFKARGYGGVSPAQVKAKLLAHFAASGTPVIMADNDTKVKGLEYKRTEDVLHRVIADLKVA